jgi:trehalose-6-phosphate synthase
VVGSIAQSQKQKMTCPICLEEKELHYKCDTCADGGFCNDCGYKVSASGFSFAPNLNTTRREIKCPCCRTENWKWVWDEFVGMMEDDIPQYHCHKKACRVFIRNQYDDPKELHEYWLEEVLWDITHEKYQLKEKETKRNN